jgi:uncharacterized protein
MNDGFELRGTPGKGDGVFATKPFKIGDTVIPGVIDKVVDGNNAHASQIGENQFVLHAGLISLVNHSCDPNCGVRVNETGAHDFVARKTISANEEITFDYAMRNYTIDHFPKMCMCGSNMCRGTITGWKDLPFETKQEYAGLVAPYLIELDARNSRERT